MKRLILGLLLIALVIGIYFYVQRDSYSTVEATEIHFAVEETELITKIEMKDRNGNEVILDKRGEEWWVNDNLPAFQPIVESFLSNTISKIKVKGPVAKTARQNVIREMVSTAIKVNIYSGNRLLNSYYVGGHDPSQMGTYMYVEGAETPYVAYIPGKDGYITPRFHLIQDDWYTRTIFDQESSEIRSIDVIYKDQPEESFSLERNDILFKLEPGIPGERINQVIARSYFALFKFKNFEGFPDYLDIEILDSIATSRPMIEVSLHNMSGETIVLKVFQKGSKTDNSLFDTKGNVLAYDPERYFAVYTGFPKMVTIQDFVFEKIFAKRTDFYR